MTAIMCALAMKLTASEKVGEYAVLSFGSVLAGSSGLRIFIFIASIVTLLGLFCMKDKYPTNMTLLAIWTLVMSVSVATSCTYAMCDPMVTVGAKGAPLPYSVARQSNAGTVRLYNGGMSCAVGTPKADDGANAVIMAAMITATIFFSLTAFTVQSKIDFSFLGAGLFVCLMVLMLFGFGMMIFGASASMYYGYCVAGAVLFSLYIIFDTWMIHNRLGPDDYIMAAIDLYLDIINLFIFILQLLNRRD
eukprot:GHVU01186017.1.p1 GENE.GHVU01186017.1~~GHVU01186017.1.p1  ORF type:complete len:278 (-),score=47.01 GHVU01186017.1:214-957(-)